jgi:hypothetical protein
MGDDWRIIGGLKASIITFSDCGFSINPLPFTFFVNLVAAGEAVIGDPKAGPIRSLKE